MPPGFRLAWIAANRRCRSSGPANWMKIIAADQRSRPKSQCARSASSVSSVTPRSAASLRALAARCWNRRPSTSIPAAPARRHCGLHHPPRPRPAYRVAGGAASPRKSVRLCAEDVVGRVESGIPWRCRCWFSSKSLRSGRSRSGLSAGRPLLSPHAAFDVEAAVTVALAEQVLRQTRRMPLWQISSSSPLWGGSVASAA